MSLKHILLGLLDQPQAGYDIKQVFEQVFRHFWSAELAQIYPALAKLEKEGLTRSRSVPSEKGPHRKVYSRTKDGTKALQDWLMEGPEVGKDKLNYLAQVFFLDSVDDPARLSFFSKLIDHFQAELETLKAVEQGWSQEDPRYPDQLPDEDLYKQLTLRLGLKKVAAIADWSQECLDLIQQRINGNE